MQTQSEVMQATMLARSEVEFFASGLQLRKQPNLTPKEPYIYHWASTMNPDVILYGFTMASIALLLCESLHIPIIGMLNHKFQKNNP